LERVGDLRDCQELFGAGVARRRQSAHGLPQIRGQIAQLFVDELAHEVAQHHLDGEMEIDCFPFHAGQTPGSRPA
jgi:hypothetical protein